MQTLAILLLLILTAITVFVVIRDDNAGRVRLMSTRNFFLLGLVVFQTMSGAVVLLRDTYPVFPLIDPGGSGVKFAVLCAAFLTVFLVVYRRCPGMTAAARQIPAASYGASLGKLFALAITCTLIGAVLRLGVRIPYIAVLTDHTGTGLAAIGAGLAAWIWAPRLMNPMIAAVAGVIILVNLGVVAEGGKQRRTVVTLLIAVLWAMYFARFRNVPKRKYMPYLAVPGVAAVLLVALLTDVRGQTRELDTGALTKVRLLTRGDPIRGLLLMSSGQDAGLASMWLMENMPERFEYRGWDTARYFAVFAVPRALFDRLGMEKGEPLSSQLPIMADMKGAELGIGGIGIGPGVVGQSWSDGGLLPVLVYAAFFGAFLRLLDEWVERNINNLFVVLAVGSPLGHTMSVPRGAVAPFFFQVVWYTFTTAVVMVLLAKLLRFPKLASGAPALAMAGHPDADLDSLGSGEGHESAPAPARGAPEPVVQEDFGAFGSLERAAPPEPAPAPEPEPARGPGEDFGSTIEWEGGWR